MIGTKALAYRFSLLYVIYKSPDIVYIKLYYHISTNISPRLRLWFSVGLLTVPVYLIFCVCRVVLCIMYVL